MIIAALHSTTKSISETMMLRIQVCSTVLLLATLAESHSYVVEVRRMVLGTFTGSPGYPRAYGEAHFYTLL